MQALTLSDITDASSTHIDQTKLKGNPSLTSSSTTDIEFNQGKPDEKAWGTFRNYIRKFTNHKGKLNKPLGKWILPLSKQRMAWSSYISNDQLHLYINTTAWVQATYNRKTKDYRNPTPVLILPEDASPVQVHEGSNTWRIHHRSSAYKIEGKLIAQTFTQHINHLPSWEQDLLRHIDLHNHTIQQIHEICKMKRCV